MLKLALYGTRYCVDGRGNKPRKRQKLFALTVILSYDNSKKQESPMELFKSSKIQHPEMPKCNPMEESEYCYYQTFGRAVMGLEKALELRRGRIDNVTVYDILDNSNVDPDDFAALFKTPRDLLLCIHDEIQAIFSCEEVMLSDMDVKLRIASIFKRLKKICPIIRVLRLLNDHSVWRENLRNFVKSIAADWPQEDTHAWQYLYANFCCQFALILEKWEESDFDDARLNDCIQLIEVWLSADGMIFDTAEGLLDDWSH